MTPEDLRDEIAKWRRRRDNPEPLNLQEPVEYARRFPMEIPREEIDVTFDVGDGRALRRALVMQRGCDKDGLPFVRFAIVQGPRLEDRSWSRPKVHPMETAMHKALDTALDAIWGPT